VLGGAGLGAPPQAPPSAPPGGGPGTGGTAAGDRQRRRWPLVTAVGGVVLAVALAGGAFLVLGGDEDEGGGPQGTGGTGTGTGTETPSSSPEVNADALPERYVGEWEGDFTIDPGLPGGTMTIVLEPGRVGEEIGTGTSSDLLSLSTCVDRLTLREVSEKEIIFDAEVDPDRSSDGTCVEGDFRYTIEPLGPNSINFSTDHPDSSSHGVLHRP
jgi:hypothetical protein